MDDASKKGDEMGCDWYGKQVHEGVRLYNEVSQVAVGYEISSVVFAAVMLLTDVIFDNPIQDRDDEMRSIIFTFNQFLAARREYEAIKQ